MWFDHIYTLISNELRFDETNECRGSACPALTDFCRNEKSANLIFDTNWHALCNNEECESLPRFPISPPVRLMSDIRKNSKCTLKPFYMQKDTPPQNMWSDCYMNGGAMKKEADGAWTLHFSGNYSNCSAEVKRVEMSHWSAKGVSNDSAYSTCIFSIRQWLIASDTFCWPLLSWEEWELFNLN